VLSERKSAFLEQYSFFLFCSSFFAHCLSLTGFHSLVNVFNSFSLSHPGHHPFPQFPQRAHSHLINVTEFCLFCILFFSIATDQAKKEIYFYLKFRMQSYRLTESKTAFVHLNCIHSLSSASWTNKQFA
jgi:hypothetical protein